MSKHSPALSVIADMIEETESTGDPLFSSAVGPVLTLAAKRIAAAERTASDLAARLETALGLLRELAVGHYGGVTCDGCAKGTTTRKAIDFLAAVDADTAREGTR